MALAFQEDLEKWKDKSKAENYIISAFDHTRHLFEVHFFSYVLPGNCFL